MMFGDSTATGYGCVSPEEVPGVLIARKLAEQSGKCVRLSTKAIVGATSTGVCSQVDAMFVAGPPPDAAVIMIGANDVTALKGVGPSAQRLASAVRRLRARDVVVVVGTCPDLGVITAIPQPLRSLAHTCGVRLARAQAVAVKAAGGVPVPLADLLAPQFRAVPELMLSSDRYHPSASAYALAAAQLQLALRNALGIDTAPTHPSPSRSATSTLGSGRPRQAIMSRLRRRPLPTDRTPLPATVAPPG